MVEKRERDFLIEDLDDEFDHLVARAGAKRARRWYRVQVIRSMGPQIGRRSSVLLNRFRSHFHKSYGWSSSVDRLKQDVKYAIRTLLKRPAFTLAAVATLAIGISANTAVFSVVNGVLFKAIPGISETEGLVQVGRTVDGRWTDMSYRIFHELRNESETLEDLAAFAFVPVSVGGTTDPTVHMGISVTGNYFELLGVQPALGRFFSPDEWFYPGVPSAAVITDRMWKERFESNPDILGTTTLVNGHSVEIIGVTRPGFNGHIGAALMDIFIPVGLDAPGVRGPSDLQNWQSGVLEFFGRTRPGVGTDEAAAELSALALAYAIDQNPAAEQFGFDVRVDTWGPIPGPVRLGVMTFSAVLMGLVGLVLTMGCINLANMILSRGVERRQEIAIRLAMGAGRARLVRQLLTESMLLVIVGGTAGVLAAKWLTDLFMAFEPPLPPGISIGLDLAIDTRVMAFSVVISVLAGLMFSLLPTLRATRPELLPALKDDPQGGSPKRSRLRQLLIGVQLGVTMFLLVVAGLFTRSLTHLEALDSGWNAEGVYVSPIDLEYGGYSREAGKEFFIDLRDRITAIAGIEEVAFAAKFPLGGRSSLGDMNVEGFDPPAGKGGFAAYFNTVSPGYFNMMDLAVLRGRDFDNFDREGTQRVAVINRTMAEHYWNGRDPIGDYFYAGPAGTGTSFEVIGVVENAKYKSLSEEPTNFYYVPQQQRYNPQMHLHVKTLAGNETAVFALIRETFREMDRGLPIPAPRPLEDALSIFSMPQRIAAWVAGIMGLVALILGAVGVYGVASFSISQRTKEIGLRIALGADRSTVISLMIKQGLAAPAIGMAVGLAAAFAAGKGLSFVIPGLQPTDPVAFLSMVTVTVLVAVLSVALPARRAASIDPMTTLKAE